MFHSNRSTCGYYLKYSSKLGLAARFLYEIYYDKFPDANELRGTLSPVCSVRLFVDCVETTWAMGATTDWPHYCCWVIIFYEHSSSDVWRSVEERADGRTYDGNNVAAS